MIRFQWLMSLTLSYLLAGAVARTAVAASAGDLSEIKSLRTTQYLDAAKRQALGAWISKQAEQLLDKEMMRFL